MPAPTEPLADAGGGPALRVLAALHLLPPRRHALLRAGLALSAAAWLPLAAIGAVEVLLAGRGEPLLRDVAVHARFLTALPLFFLAEEVLVRRTRRALERFAGGGFVAEADLEALAHHVSWASRLRASGLAEALLLVCALARGVEVLISSTAAELTPARVWYALLALPLFLFFYFRWMWRWVIWSLLLVRMARLELRPLFAHPDHAGGLAYLASPTAAFALYAGGSATVIAGDWTTRMLHEGLHVSVFAPAFAFAVAAALVAAFAALLAFVPDLQRARFEGSRQYNVLALRHARRFHRRWIEGVDDGDDQLLGSPDMSSLVDLNTTVQDMMKMRLVPFGTRDAVIVFVAMLAPVLPLVALDVPLSELLAKLGRAMLGGLPS